MRFFQKEIVKMRVMDGVQTDCGSGEKYARLAQSVEHETLNLRVVGSSPTLGVLILQIVKCLKRGKSIDLFANFSSGCILNRFGLSF